MNTNCNNSGKVKSIILIPKNIYKWNNAINSFDNYALHMEAVKKYLKKKAKGKTGV